MSKLTCRALSKVLGVPTLIAEEDVKEGSCFSACFSDKKPFSWKKVEKGIENLPSVDDDLKDL